MAQIIIDKQNGELAFRLERFENLNQFDHLQRKNYYSIILLKGNNYKLNVDISNYEMTPEQIEWLLQFKYASERANREAAELAKLARLAKLRGKS